MISALTAEQLYQAYKFLVVLPPFAEWNMPSADEIEFQVVGDPALLGWHRCNPANGTPILAISNKGVGHVASLIMVMAHEMVHLSQTVNGTAPRPEVKHNRDFRNRAKLVCNILGFDYKQFV